MDRSELRLQREFDRIELVSGLGNPQADTACLMSLVARLAGEGHTDRPHCASPLIGAFVIPLNDRMPHAARQRLKPFALRIIGTRDGQDAMRVAVLRAALAQEILPGITARLQAGHRRTPCYGAVSRAWATMQRGALHGQVLRLLQDPGIAARPDRGIALAHATGQLLALSANLARDPEDAAWYWGAAIGLLDRLCDAGAAETEPTEPAQPSLPAATLA